MVHPSYQANYSTPRKKPVPQTRTAEYYSDSGTTGRVRASPQSKAQHSIYHSLENDGQNGTDSDSNAFEDRASPRKIRDPKHPRPSGSANHKSLAGVGRRRPQDLATPGRHGSDSNTVYAGSSFHASPAASALPIPSIIANRSPIHEPFGRVQSAPPADHSALVPHRPGLSTVPSAPITSPSCPPVQRGESPLEFLFQAKREEMARAGSVISGLGRLPITNRPVSPPEINDVWNPSALETDITSQSPLRTRSKGSHLSPADYWVPEMSDGNEMEDDEEPNSDVLRALLFGRPSVFEGDKVQEADARSIPHATPHSEKMPAQIRSPRHVRQPSKLKDELTLPSQEVPISASLPSAGRKYPKHALPDALQYHPAILATTSDPFTTKPVSVDSPNRQDREAPDIQRMEDDLRRILRLA